MKLWPEWTKKLNTKTNPIQIKTPLIKLANSEDELARMKLLVKQKENLGLKIVTKDLHTLSKREWPFNHYGGLLSKNDGFLNPITLQKSLKELLNKKEVQQIPESVISIERRSSQPGQRWGIHLTDGSFHKLDSIIICCSLGAESLLKQLDYYIKQEPILGQAMELELKSDSYDWSNWPAVLISNGINLIPRSNNRLWLGATLEPSLKPNNDLLQELKNLKGNAPCWLLDSKIINQWYGLRGRPVNRPAPILEKLEPGLIVAAGHYRNGILLAPATAEWIGNKINFNGKEYF